MHHPWQHLLFHLYQDGRSWVTRLSADDWRRSAGKPGVVADLDIHLIGERGEAQHLLNATSKPADAPRKGFVIRPGKFGETALTVLVPFILVNDAAPRLSLQLGVLERGGQGTTFFGYRFETPEDGNEHHFFHAQPVKAFGRGAPIQHAIAWYPERYPAFPLAARNAIELIASLLVATREWRQMVALTAHNQVSQPARLAVGQFMQRIRSPDAA